MKHIFLDTNFVVDYLLREEYKDICKEFLSVGVKNKCVFYISALTIANFAYIARNASKDELYNYLTLLTELFVIIPGDLSQIKSAIALKAKDFEDALQYEAALSQGCDYIISRNKKDFPFSIIPVLSAAEYLQQLSR